MRSKTVLLLTIVFGIISMLYSTRVGGIHNALITNSASLLPPLLATIYGFYAYRTYAPTSPHGRSLLFISTGLMFLFIGKVSFFTFQFIFKINPYPSIADLSFLASYPFIGAGLLSEIRTSKSALKDMNQFIQLLITIIMIMLSLAVLFFGIILAYQTGKPLLDNIVAMLYGVGDLILIIPTLLVLKVAVDYRGGRLFMSWGLILIALLLKLYADVFFAIYRNQYTALEWTVNMIDLVWLTSYILFAYSFYSTASHVREVRAKFK